MTLDNCCREEGCISGTHLGVYCTRNWYRKRENNEIVAEMKFFYPHFADNTEDVAVDNNNSVVELKDMEPGWLAEKFGDDERHLDDQISIHRLRFAYLALVAVADPLACPSPSLMKTNFVFSQALVTTRQPYQHL